MARSARQLVEEIIAGAREAGTVPAHEARRRIAEWLRELGYQVEEHQFQFNAGMYRAFFIAAFLLDITTLITAVLLILPTSRWAALAALVIGYGAAAVVGRHLVLHPLRASDLRQDANLIARLPGTETSCWLVAHVDTKAQGHSMAGRLVGIWVIVVMTLVLFALAAWRLGGPLPLPAAASALVAGSLAAWCVGQGRLRGGSPGARDNGSGVLAVLTAAGSSPSTAPGVIITSAEEFALAGARALAREHPHLFAGRTVINVDTVDDEGTLYLLPHDDRDMALAARLAPLLQELGEAAIRRVPRAIMVDSQPLSRVARETVTVARLSWSTLRRVHTVRDDAADFRLEGAERLGNRLADAI